MCARVVFLIKFTFSKNVGADIIRPWGLLSSA